MVMSAIEICAIQIAFGSQLLSKIYCADVPDLLCLISIPPLPLSTKKSTSANQSTDKNNETQESDLFSLYRVILCWTRNRYL